MSTLKDDTESVCLMEVENGIAIEGRGSFQIPNESSTLGSLLQA